MRDDDGEAVVAGEAGFSLIEVVVCVALVVAACVAGIGLLPALAHASQSGILRDAATNVARVAIERARAATAYYPPTGYQTDHTFALNAAASYAVAVRVHRALCAANQSVTIVPMNVQLTYIATSDTVSVTVAYPRDPCGTALDEGVVLSAPLAPSAPAPGTNIITPIGDPSQQ
jgi:type II secretory pathway pseudopilin PulG